MTRSLWLPIVALATSVALPAQTANPIVSSAKEIYPSCAENPAVQGGDVERGERSSPKLNSVSAAARCTGG